MGRDGAGQVGQPAGRGLAAAALPAGVPDAAGAAAAAEGGDEDGRWASYVIQERAAGLNVLPSGVVSRAFGYGGHVPGPTIHVERGTRVIAKVRNRLPDVHPMFGHKFDTSTHLHGNASLPEYDGYASDVTPPGTQGLPVAQVLPGRPDALVPRPRVPPHRRERLLGPAGAVPRPRPRRAGAAAAAAVRRPADGLGRDVRRGRPAGLRRPARSGLWGDVVLVNGVPWPVMKVQRRVYRFRMLNASVSRSYRPILCPGARCTWSPPTAA